MIAALFVLVSVLFCAKIAWNLTVPYSLVVWSKPGDTGGISLMPAFELLLLVLGVVLAWLGAKQWPWNAPGVALIGGLLVVGSYIHLVAAAVVVGWIASRRRDKQQG